MVTKIIWKNKMCFEAQAESGHKILLDLPEKSGGEDKGPRPGELVLVSLAGCTAVDVVSILKKMREKLDGLEVVVKSESAEQHPKVLKKVQIGYNLKGGNLKEDKVKRAIELSMEKYCSVKAMLERTAEITYSFTITNS